MIAIAVVSILFIASIYTLVFNFVNFLVNSNVKRLKNYLFLVFVMLIVSGCSTKTVSPSTGIPAPPTKVESVQPKLSKVQSNIDKSIVENTKVSEALKNQTKQLLDQKSKIIDAIEISERFKGSAKGKQLISELDAMALNVKLLAIQGSNKELELQNLELSKKLAEAGKLLEETKADAQKTMGALISKEYETTELISQNKFLANNLTSRNEDVETLQKENTKLEKKAASASVYKNWIIGLATGFILWTILKNILLIYWPSARFRI